MKTKKQNTRTYKKGEVMFGNSKIFKTDLEKDDKLYTKAQNAGLIYTENYKRPECSWSAYTSFKDGFVAGWIAYKKQGVRK